MFYSHCAGKKAETGWGIFTESKIESRETKNMASFEK